MLDAFHEKRMALVTSVGELVALSDRMGAVSIAQRIRTGLVDKLEADRFNLVVVGEFNHGKTSLVNALLGAPVLPVGVTPTTAVIHEIEYAEEPSARAEYESGESRELPFETVRHFAIGNPAPEPDPGPVKALHIRYPALFLKDRIALVDTPGVNDLSLQRADITYKYIPQCDAVLFLLDAGQLLTASERVFLQEKLLGQSRDKIIFVVTKKDILTPSEFDEAMSYVHQHLARLVESPRVFAVSAEAATEGRRGESGIDELLEHLYRFLTEERGRILLDNALGQAMEACVLVLKGLDAKRRALAMDVQEIDRRIEAVERELAGHVRTTEERRISIREDVAAIKAVMRRDLERMVEDISRQIPGIVEEARVEDLRLHLGPFVEKAFRDWAEAQTREISESLEKLAEKIVALVREDAHVAGRKLASTMGADIKAPDIEVNTFAYDVGVSAVAIVGLGVLFANLTLGLALLAAAPVLALFARGLIESETKSRAKELAPAAIRDAAARVGPRFEELIDDFAKRLDAWVVSASDEVYRGVLEALATAKRDRQQGTEAHAKAVAACDEYASSLESLRLGFETSRAALWTPADAAADPAA